MRKVFAVIAAPILFLSFAARGEEKKPDQPPPGQADPHRLHAPARLLGSLRCPTDENAKKNYPQLKRIVDMQRCGSGIAVLTDYGKVRVWDRTGSKELPGFQLKAGSYNCKLAVSGNGGILAVANQEQIRVWDRFRQKTLWKGIEDSQTADRRRAFLAMDAKGQQEYIRSEGKVPCREKNLLEAPGGAPASFRQIESLAVSSDGESLAACMHTCIPVWELKTGRCVAVLGAKPREWQALYVWLQFSPRGDELFSWADWWDPPAVRVWDCRGGKIRRVFPLPDGHGRPALSPDGQTVFFEARPGRIRLDHRLLQASTGRQISIMASTTVYTKAFSADGKLLVTGGEKGKLRIWETASYRPLWALDCPASHDKHQANRLVTFDRGRKIAVVHYGQKDNPAAQVWSLVPPGEEQSSPFAAEQLQDLWNDLASEDALVGYRAVWKLATDPAKAVSFLAGKLEPIRPPPVDKVQALIRQLDSKKFAERQKATEALALQAEEAEPELRKAQGDRTSLEMTQRLESILKELPRYPLAPSYLRRVRAIQALERIGNNDAKEVLKKLAGGVPTALLTRDAAAALQRLEWEEDGQTGKK